VKRCDFLEFFEWKNATLVICVAYQIKAQSLGYSFVYRVFGTSENLKEKIAKK
jgi:hypothetical protein